MRININNDNSGQLTIGDNLLFIRGKDEKFLAFGFSKVELDQRTLQDLSVSCAEEDGEERQIKILIGKVERIKSYPQ